MRRNRRTSSLSWKRRGRPLKRQLYEPDLKPAKRRALVCPQLRCYNKRMNKPLKLIPIGNSTGVILPKEMLRELAGRAGAEHLVTSRTPNGSRAAAGRRGFRAADGSAREIMRRRIGDACANSPNERPVVLDLGGARKLSPLTTNNWRNMGRRRGIRDKGALESAMARPQNLAAYGEPDAAALAASYAFGIARNHPFVDGNKRTACGVSEGYSAI